MFAKSFASVIVAALAVAPSVNAHGFIKLWGVQGSQLERAQKTDLKSSSFRSSPDNTGWIGDKFVNSAAITCGSSNTPFNTVASPGGTIFANAGQSAGRELNINAGQSVQVVVSGNPGEGWPHPRGHVQAYLASCGGSCTNFDASKGKFFKILSEVGGIEKTLKPAYDGSVDGNRYNIKIPGSVPSGSYILRYELIALGQSSNAEGQQSQYYPFCGQLNVKNGAKFSNNAQLQTVTFPGAYKAGNVAANAAPGPSVLASGSTAISGSTGTTTDSSSSSGTKSKQQSGSSSSSSSSAGISLKSGAPQCASMCLGVKISEAGHLAPSCGANDGACMCSQTNTFVAAFNNCARDNCSGEDLEAAKSAFADACSAVGGEEDDEEDCDEDDEKTKRDLEAIDREFEALKLRARGAARPIAVSEQQKRNERPAVVARNNVVVVPSRAHSARGVKNVSHGRMVKTRRSAQSVDVGAKVIKA